jgi:hypothetical protein
VNLTCLSRRTTFTVSVLAGAALAIVIATGALAGPHAPASHPSQAERLRQLERARARSMVDADIPTARRLMAGDFQLINPGGQPLSREELLGAVGSGQLDFLINEPSSRIVVRRAGTAAVLRYQRSFDLVIAGTRLTHKAWSTVLYERRRGRWLAVWEQTTAIPNRPDLFLESLKPIP